MHALLLEGSYEWALVRLPERARTHGPDVVHYTGARMSVDEVRTLTSEAHLTPMNGNERIFVLAYAEFTREAQNALLKLLEEPPITARFYIVTERSGTLLPTLRSRLVQTDREDHSYDDQEFTEFQRLSYGERLERIGTRAQKKDDAWMRALMGAFEVWAHEQKDVTFMKSFIELQPFFHTSGASRKMILEHLALLLPPPSVDG